MVPSADRLRLIEARREEGYRTEMYQSDDYNYDGKTEWAGLIRKLERSQPDYKA